MSTLKQVGQLALNDKAFFEALVANRDNLQPTLAAYKLSLDDKQAERLASALTEPTGPREFNLVEFIRRIHRLPPGQNPFIGWDTDWDLSWIPIHLPHRDGA